jgi:AcrR family transcriptional regulator
MTKVSNRVIEPPARNREATRGQLIKAVGEILAEKGFAALGVNAVARQAKVDKVLIYRYFDNLEGLTKAFAQDGDFWPSIAELAGGDIAAYHLLPLEEKLIALGRNFLRGIRARPLTQEIMAWEMVERNKLTEELEKVREIQMLRFFEQFFSKENGSIDLMAIMSIIGGGLSFLICRSRHIQWYNGVDLKSDEGWARIEGGVEQIIRKLM